MNPPALRFGRYESLFRINAGGMAEVFAARARGEGGFEKIVAVKRILPHLLSDDRFVRMFLDEARVAACIESPNVVQTLDVGRDPTGGPYLAMELVIGLTLFELIKLSARARRAVPRDVLLEILMQGAAGLEAAHEARTARGEPLEIVHRDVSPQNLLVGADGRVRVSDFGIAQVALGKLAETQVGEVKGKYAYLSPEQSRGERLDRRSDVFALGIVAWEAIAGRRLFHSASPFDTIEAVRRAPIPRLGQIDATVSMQLEAAVARALERRREDRWPTARAFAAALRASHGTSGPEGIARWVDELHSDRVEQMRDRIRRATTLPTHETLPDLRIEDTDAPAEPIGDAVTELLASRPTQAGVSDTIADATTPPVAAPVTSRRAIALRPLAIAAALVVLGVMTAAIVSFLDGGPSAPVIVPSPVEVVSAVSAPPAALSEPAAVGPSVATPAPSEDTPPTTPAEPTPPEPAAAPRHEPEQAPEPARAHAPAGASDRSAERSDDRRDEPPAAARSRGRGPLDLGAFDRAVSPP